MAKVVEELITKWTYKVDTRQIKDAIGLVKSLKKSFKAVGVQSTEFSKGEVARVNKVRTAWRGLNTEVSGYRKNIGRGFGGRSKGGKGKGKGGGGRASGPNPFAFVGGQVLGSGLATSLGLLGAVNPLAAVGVGAAIGIGKSIQLAGAREQAQITLGALLKSDEAAAGLLDKLNEFGKITPFDIPTLRQLSVEMLATGTSLDNIIPMLRTMGNLTRGNNVTLRRMIINLGQIRGKGNLQTRDLREFATAGIPLAAELAKNLGVTREALDKLITGRKVKFADVLKAMQTLTTGAGKFAGLMKKIEKTLGGVFGRFLDSLIVLGETVGGPLLPIAIGVLKGLASVIEGVTELLQSMGTVYGAIFGPILGFFADLLPSMDGMSEGTRRLLNPFTLLLDIWQDLAVFAKGEGKSLLGHILGKIGEANPLTGIFDKIKLKIDEISKTDFIQVMKKGLNVLDSSPGGIFSTLGGLLGSTVPQSAGSSFAANGTFNQNVSIGLQQGVGTQDAINMMNQTGSTLLDNMNHRLQPNSVA